jgi:hypothetical protein
MTQMVLTDDVVVATDDDAPEFSWRAVFAGSLVGSATIFFLLFLGTGVGLSIVTVPEATANTAVSGLTLGGIYFFACQAFGMAVGGYLAGRLMGPLLESESEELFHSSTHGLVVWAVSVIATATMVAISGLVLSSSGLTAAAIYGVPNIASEQSNNTLTPGVAGYWVDTLFRPAASPSPSAAAVPQPGEAAATGTSASLPAERTAEARAEANRILTVGMAKGGQLSQSDHDRLAALVAQSTGADAMTSSQRVDDVQNRIHQQEVSAAEIARKTIRSISLLLAASLIFGALVASAAAVLGRSVDDKARLAS